MPVPVLFCRVVAAVLPDALGILVRFCFVDQAARQNPASVLDQTGGVQFPA